MTSNGVATESEQSLNAQRLESRSAMASCLGRYELIAELARGGMGRVFLAHRIGDTELKRLYAVKVLHDHMAKEPEAVKMVIDEANLASKIRHHNVVSIVDLGVHDERYYLVMGYIEGPNLEDLLRRNGTLRPPELVVPLLLDALRGLHAAHELTDASGALLDLIHRDVSPSNLLVGIDGVCRVSDFGVAKARARLTRTRRNLQKGTIASMAPEQLSANETLDRRVDIWAVGVAAWQALTGLHPFDGTSYGVTIQQIMERELPSPSTVGLRPPACFDELILKALNRDRELRPASAQEMADELQDIAIHNGLLAPRSDVTTWVSRSFEKELAKRRRYLQFCKKKIAARISKADRIPGNQSSESAEVEHRTALRESVAKAEKIASRTLGPRIAVLKPGEPLASAQAPSFAHSRKVGAAPPPAPPSPKPPSPKPPPAHRPATEHCPLTPLPPPLPTPTPSEPLLPERSRRDVRPPPPARIPSPMAFWTPRPTLRRTVLNILVGLAIIVIIGFTLCVAALVGAEPQHVSQRVDAHEMSVQQGLHR